MRFRLSYNLREFNVYLTNILQVKFHRLQTVEDKFASLGHFLYDLEI